MPRTQDAEERPDNPVHFHRLDNRSRIVLPSDILVGRLVVKVLTLHFFVEHLMRPPTDVYCP